MRYSFLNLAQHRFASHCCETLFIRCAPIVNTETASTPMTNGHHAENSEPQVSMENLFLYTINELHGNLGFLLTDRFGSHTVRVLLVIFSGQPLDQASAKSNIGSKRKEHVNVAGADGGKQKKALAKRAVPKSFTTALERMMQESIAGLDTNYLRSLATHAIGNPMLQLLLHLDLEHFGKQRAKDEQSIIHKLLPDEDLAEGTESASFINGLIFDTIGSRLLETIIEDAPGKLFKTLYRDYFKDRMASLARNEIAGYVVAKLLERLGKEDLKNACDNILPQLPSLAERGRTSIIRTLVQRCVARAVDNSSLAAALRTTYTEDEGATFSIGKLLNIATPIEPAVQVSPARSASCSAEPTTENTKQVQHASEQPGGEDLPPIDQKHQDTTSLSTTPSTLHASLLAQTMLTVQGPMSLMVFDAINFLPPNLLISIACTPALSPILQSALTITHAPVMFRRKLIKSFYSHIFALSVDSAGSHLVDAIWGGTQGMAFVRERIAEELAENEAQLRESQYGRKVWRNWWMDLYKRRRGEWVKKIRIEVGNDGFLSFPGGIEDVEAGKPKDNLTPSEANAIRRNKGPTRRNHSLHHSDAEGKEVVSAAKGPSSSSGRLESGDHVRRKTGIELARERYAKAHKTGPVQGYGPG